MSPRELTRVKPALEEDAIEEITSTDLDEFAPPPSNRLTKEVDLPVKGGWARTQRPKSTGFTQVPRFKVPDDGEEVLIKFLDDVPFAAYYQHWLMTDAGRRAYTCAGFNDCPVCARGDRAKSSDLINVVVLGPTPEPFVWFMSADPSSAVEERATNKRTSPLNKAGLYFAVSKKKGTNGFFSYTLDPVREDELKEDWGANPLTDQQIAAFSNKKFDSSIVRIHTNAELADAAQRYVDE